MHLAEVNTKSAFIIDPPQIVVDESDDSSTCQGITESVNGEQFVVK